MSVADLKFDKRVSDMDAEEKRLLDSFKLHEAATRSPHKDKHDQQQLVESVVVDQPPRPATSHAEMLTNEAEELGGTFGDPRKLPERTNLIEANKYDDENDPTPRQDQDHEENKETEPLIRMEPGPAFATSLLREGSPGDHYDPGNGGSENPFHWVDAQSGGNMSKLVGFGD